MSNDVILQEIDRLLDLCEKATPGPWEFRDGNDQHGDWCDLLMAEVGEHADDEDPEYAEVLFPGGEFGDWQVGANWELVPALRNCAPALLRLLAAMLEERRSRQARGLWNISGWECGHGTPCGAACKECVAGPVYCADEDMATAEAAIKEQAK